MGIDHQSRSCLIIAGAGRERLQHNLKAASGAGAALQVPAVEATESIVRCTRQDCMSFGPMYLRWYSLSLAMHEEDGVLFWRVLLYGAANWAANCKEDTIRKI